MNSRFFAVACGRLARRGARLHGKHAAKANYKIARKVRVIVYEK